MAEVWDVVCGVKGDSEKWKSSAEYKGTRYYFCCDGCKGAFLRSPDYHLENFAADHPAAVPTPSRGCCHG